jgi:hypothetical protein
MTVSYKTETNLFGGPSLDLKSVKFLLDFLLSKVENPPILNYSAQTYGEKRYEFLDELFLSLQQSSFVSEEDGISPERYYVDMGAPKSSLYYEYYKKIHKLIQFMGESRSEWYGKEYGLRVFYETENTPWETYSIERLKRTEDFYWFLVLVIQRIGSCTSKYGDHILANLEKIGKSIPGTFSLNWFSPFYRWFDRNKLMSEFSSIQKSINTDDFIPENYSYINPVDSSEIAEYDVGDRYRVFDGKYYDVMDIALAITASGGLAQSLERQDLEPSVTGVGKILRAKKKKLKLTKGAK